MGLFMYAPSFLVDLPNRRFSFFFLSFFFFFSFFTYLFSWFLLEVCLAGVVINVNPGGSVLVSCGDLNDPCASLSAAFASTTMGEGATIKIADNAVLLGPDNVNCVVAFKSVVISGGVGSTIDGGGQIVVSVSADLLRTEGPTFVSLNFVNATIALGISSGSVQLSRFQGSGGRCGIVYAGERPSGSQQIDLSVLETSFEGSCGINVNSGGASRKKKPIFSPA